MNNGSDSGLQIVRRQGEGRPDALAEAWQVILSALVFFALGGALAAACELGGRISCLPAALAGLLICAAAPFLRRLPHKKYIALGLLIAFLLVIALFSRQITDGLCLCWNGWCDVRTAATGRLFPGKAVYAAAEEQASLMLLASVFGACILATASCLALRLCRIAAAAACLGLAVTLTALLRPETCGAATALLLLAGALVLAYTMDSECSRSGAQTVAAGALVAVAGAVLLAAVLAFPSVRSASLFAQLREDAWARVHAAQYELGAQVLPEGKLSALGGRNNTGRIMLSVQMEQAEPLYLRGFTGQAYTPEAWQPLSTRELARQADLLYWLHSQGLYPQTQTGVVGTLLNDTVETQTNRVSVVNQAACSRYIYAPCSVLWESCAQYLPLLELNEAALVSPAGERQTAYTTLYRAAEKTVDWVQALRASDEAAVEYYLALESGYRALTREYYLALPDQTRQTLAPYLDALAQEYTGGGALSAQEAVDLTKRFLDETLTYSEDTVKLPEGADFLSYTLESGKGYDVHYATLSVLALRYYGVAARYAEGYIVTQETAEQAAAGPVGLDDSCAHAWVEVYQDGVGWMPLEMTPNYASHMGSAPQAGGLSAGLAAPEDTQSGVGTAPGEGDGAHISAGAEYEPEAEQNAGETDDGQAPENAPVPRTTIERLRRAALLLLLAIFVLLAAAAAVILAVRRTRILRRRQARFASEALSDAIGWRFAHSARQLEWLGFSRGGGGMLALADGIGRELGAEYGAQFLRAARINREALFSTHPMTREQLEAVSAFCAATTALLKEKNGFAQRLKLRWIECLY